MSEENGAQSQNLLRNPVVVAAIISGVVLIVVTLISQWGAFSATPAPTPTPALLTIADFEEGFSFSADTILKTDQPEACLVNITANGWVELETLESDTQNRCGLKIPAPRSLANFGLVQADFMMQEEDTGADSEAYITAEATTKDGIIIQIDCGLDQHAGGLQAFFYVAAVTRRSDPEPFCPVDDASDHRCDLYFGGFNDLNLGQSYNVRLESVGESPGRLRCTVGDMAKDFTLTVQDLNIDDETVKQLEFDRHIEAEFSAGSTAVFAADNVMESR